MPARHRRVTTRSQAYLLVVVVSHTVSHQNYLKITLVGNSAKHHVHMVSREESSSEMKEDTGIGFKRFSEVYNVQR